MIWIIVIGVMVLSYIIQAMLQSRFNKYSQVPTSNGMTGADIARKMLRDNGITDVEVTSVRGTLTDHYNPQTKTVNLSEAVYGQRNIAAAAVAAHECGVTDRSSYVRPSSLSSTSPTRPCSGSSLPESCSSR